MSESTNFLCSLWSLPCQEGNVIFWDYEVFESINWKHSAVLNFGFLFFRFSAQLLVLQKVCNAFFLEILHELKHSLKFFLTFTLKALLHSSKGLLSNLFFVLDYDLEQVTNCFFRITLYLYKRCQIETRFGQKLVF